MNAAALTIHESTTASMNNDDIEMDTNSAIAIDDSISTENEDIEKIVTNDENHMDRYERFENWLRDNGARFDMLELREYTKEVEEVSLSLQKDAEEEQRMDSNNDNTSDIEFEYNPNSSEEKKEPQSSSSSIHAKISDMRGVHAKASIPPNVICMSIPRKCLITVEMGQATSIGQAILHSDLELDAPKHIFLMIYLLWDQKINSTNSFFYPYYSILPNSLSNMPIFWNIHDLSYLQGSYLLTQIHDRNDAIEEDYHAICEVAPELAELATLEEFKWARMCVCSRNFGLQIDGQRTSALVPHADMLNHHRPRETKWTFDDERQAFTITTLQGIQSGAQVFDSYGQKCNHRFLLNYGFAVEDNREIDGFCPNEVPLELSIPPVLFLEQKYEFWTMCGGGVSPIAALTEQERLQHPYNNSSKRVRVCVSNNENTRILFSMLRVIVANEAEIQAIMASTSPTSAATTNALTRTVLGFAAGNSCASPSTASSPYRTCRDIRCPISFRNEYAAMTHLFSLTTKALEHYPTTYEQDVKDLQNEVRFPRFSNRRHAKIQVRGEKEVLLHFQLWSQLAIQVMDVIENEIYSELSASSNTSSLNNGVSEYDVMLRNMEENEGNVHHTILRYCADVLGALRREEKKRRKKNILNSVSSAVNVNSSATAL